MQSRPGLHGLNLPPLRPWMRNLFIGLVALYVLEATERRGGGLVDSLGWHPFGGGFELWQPLTHLITQGPGTGGAVRLLLTVGVLWFLLPTVSAVVDRRSILEALGAGLVAGLGLGLVGGLIGGPVAWGATPVLVALVVLISLAMPTGRGLFLLFVPVQASWMVWLTLGLSLFFVVLAPGIDSLEHLGAWSGAMAWWHLRGPGARRRHLKRRAESITHELRRFEVIEGGRRDDDDLVH